MIAILAAALFIVLLAMVAFAVDIGYLNLARSQLQVAADASALAAAGSSNLSQSEVIAVAQQFANANVVADRQVQLQPSDVVFGSWDAATNTFTPGGGLGSAVQVTVRTSGSAGGETPLFFANIFGFGSKAESATAIATANPRDIAFVVDLSGSMNDDTSPNSSSSSSTLMQAVYDEFGFGTYPGTYQTVSSYQPNTWIMTNQIVPTMPNAVPVPDVNSPASVSYWGGYISYVKSGTRRIGYQSYLEFMMDKGRDVTADGTTYTPLSTNSPICQKHYETVGATSFHFPAREMPTHAVRRAMIAALQVVKARNQGVSDLNQCDWASLITFDRGNAVIVQPLTNNYDTVMTACTQLQACSDNSASTNSESGMIAAYNHIKPASQGGAGRERANKIVVFMTDGMPNLKISTNTAITNYIAAHPSTYTNPTTGVATSNWSTSSSNQINKNAALMQANIMQGSNWFIYSAGVGLGCDYEYMDLMARMGNTANTNGQCPRGSGDPAVYEAVLTQIFQNIVTNPKLRLVK